DLVEAHAAEHAVDVVAGGDDDASPSPGRSHPLGDTRQEPEVGAVQVLRFGEVEDEPPYAPLLENAVGETVDRRGQHVVHSPEVAQDMEALSLGVGDVPVRHAAP